MSLFYVATAQAAQVKLAWDASTSAGVTGYNVYYGTTSGTYPNKQDAHNATTYTTPDLSNGTYYFVVKAYNGAGNESGPSNEVSANTSSPVANISANPTTGTAPLTVTFNGTSTGGTATTWSWNFGDNTTSTAQNPSKTYSSAGTYTVALTASGPGGSNTATQANYITVTAPATAPAASFTASPTSGPAPLLVTFTDTSTGSIISRSWTFGDGTTDTSQTVAKTFNTAGTYTATLKVTGSGGSTTATKTITATAVAPAASFTASPTSGVAPLTTTFTNTSTGNITSYAWDFGDGTTSTVQNPASHTYTNTGNYTVTLTATGPTGTTPSTKTQTITVTAASAGSGLVAAYNFEEASGTTVVDASGKGNHGTITEATRTSSGKYGQALSFDGVNDWVTVNDSASLDLTTGMTLEAWVYPTAISGNRTILIKENAPGSAYYLYANTSDDSPNTPLGGGVFAGQYKFVYGSSTLPTNAWAHVAVTYDGATERLYVNGNQVASKAQTGSMQVSTGPLRIGGNSMWSEFFKGYIDEIRIYNRALSATEIQTDMNTAVATSSPPKRLLGDETGTSVAYTQQGVPIAFQAKASVDGMVTSLAVYLDTGSTSTPLVAGLYTDSSGSPGTLLAQGTLSAPQAGVLNRVLLPATAVKANTPYWVAVLSPSGVLKYKAGSVARPIVTSNQTTLPSLPSPWKTISSTSGGMPAYGAGY